MKVTRLRFVADKGPQNDGARPWTTIYTVTVKLTAKKLHASSLETAPKARKYMLEERGEKNAAMEAMYTIHRFLPREKTLYGGSSCDCSGL